MSTGHGPTDHRFCIAPTVSFPFTESRTVGRIPHAIEQYEYGDLIALQLAVLVHVR